MDTNIELSKKNNLPKIILLVLAVIIVFEEGFAGWILTRPINQRPAAHPQKVSGGKLILTAPNRIYKSGDIVWVTIGETTGSKSVEGTDIVIKYDPKVLEASSGAFEKGTFYKEYSPMSLDPKTCTVQISGIQGFNQKPIVGTGIFGNFKFKVKQGVKTSVKLDFTPGLTTDSNMVDASSGKDALEEVFNLVLDIQ